jgi:hypothetical protein
MDELFQAYPKTPRLNREAIVTEKLDGTNAQVVIDFATDAQKAGHLEGPYIACVGDFVLRAGSRSKWITPGKTSDNYGFSQWVKDNAADLVNLGPGKHFGEWWGAGIQRGYGLKEKRFSLFNAGKWVDRHTTAPDGDTAGCVLPEKMAFAPKCCHVVPVFWRGVFDSRDVDNCLYMLRTNGSYAAPGFMNPEGVIVYHTAAGQCFKVLLENDDKPKGVEIARAE